MPISVTFAAELKIDARLVLTKLQIHTLCNNIHHTTLRVTALLNYLLAPIPSPT